MYHFNQLIINNLYNYILFIEEIGKANYGYLARLSN